ncbi:hypothetical protein OUZ56_011178 [Daphnia magna]|uniref:Uncharacterized protein n=1 Tax=Daphnia magna TaxID=35525 RepID=A0ABQ9YZG5_9CRUS|nr:hypothetical protein OUZ56_011178 [Daphnia magna]
MSSSDALSELLYLKCSNKKLHGEEALVLYLICHLLGKMEKDQGLMNKEVYEVVLILERLFDVVQDVFLVDKTS